jgi:patatin-like phospholipase/acyl hydrolase
MPDEETPPPLRILCLDGADCFSTLQIHLLSHLLRHVDGNSTDTAASKHFDLICGTSGGGVLALLLATRTVDQVERDFNRFVEQVFDNHLKLSRQERLQRLEKAADALFGDDLMLLNNPEATRVSLSLPSRLHLDIA